MDTAIIGIQGVGMAHAMAVERCGHRVVAVLDPDPAAKDRLGDEWVNEFGTFRQVLTPRHKPEYFDSPESFARVQGDLLIVACPTQWHLDYSRRFGSNFNAILCEKPVDYSAAEIAAMPSDLKRKFFVGHNYLLHEGSPARVNPVCVIRYAHNVLPAKAHLRDCGVWWDMGTHCVAQMLKYVPEVEWDGIRCVTKTVTPLEASATMVAGSRVFVLQAAYSDHQQGFYVDDIKLRGFDVFGAQIEALAQQRHPGHHRLAYTVTKLAAEVAPYTLVAVS